MLKLINQINNDDNNDNPFVLLNSGSHSIKQTPIDNYDKVEADKFSEHKRNYDDFSMHLLQIKKLIVLIYYQARINMVMIGMI